MQLQSFIVARQCVLDVDTQEQLIVGLVVSAQFTHPDEFPLHPTDTSLSVAQFMWCSMTHVLRSSSELAQSDGLRLVFRWVGPDGSVLRELTRAIKSTAQLHRHVQKATSIVLSGSGMYRLDLLASVQATGPVVKLASYPIAIEVNELHGVKGSQAVS